MSLFSTRRHSKSKASKSSQLDEVDPLALQFSADWLEQARAENQETLESNERAENKGKRPRLIEMLADNAIEVPLERKAEAEDERMRAGLFAPVDWRSRQPASSGDAGASTSGAAPQVTSEQTTPEQVTPEGVEGTAAGQHPDASAIAQEGTDSLLRELRPQAGPPLAPSSDTLPIVPFEHSQYETRESVSPPQRGLRG
ncbi:MAG: hypothetical protein JF606_28675 [Burkholderiales bacterium]|nr:hypothetical protein [Burkholderiales bacterium]